MMERIEKTAFGYPDTPYRVEYRPHRGLHTKEELTRILDLLEKQGVKAWWYSVAAKGSFPLFQSKSLPYRDDADTAVYRWLVKEAHRRGIALMSWEYLNCAPLAAEKHPEWRYRYFGEESAERSTRDNHFVCHNSPYGELLKSYCLEVVEDIGFDGIWFDGSYLHSDDNGLMACRCAYCETQYRKESGRVLPERIDLRDPAFRHYMEWRYENFTGYWRSLSAYVKQRCPEALIVFNYFNRFGCDERSGSPLRRMPMDALIAAESCSRPYQLLLQHKTLRALNGNYPTEVWDYFRDAAQNSAAVPEPEAASMLFHALGSATAGGYASFGFEADPSEYVGLLAELSAALNPIAPYIGGTQPPGVGLVLSGTTKDYGHVLESGLPDSWRTWKSVLGLHNLLNALHWPSEVLLDNMLTEPYLSLHEAVALPDVRCLSDTAATELRRYVEQGGLLLITGASGTLTEEGQPREQGVFDAWFNMEWRDRTASRPLLEQVCITGLEGVLPQHFMLSGEAHLFRTRNCEVLAEGSYVVPLPRHTWIKDGSATNPSPAVRGEAIVRKRLGKGAAVWIASDIGTGYSEQPSRRTREVVRAILQEHREQPFRTDAPANVAVTMWKQGAGIVFHILNVPHSLLHIPADSRSLFYPEDFTPTRPITIEVPGEWSEVFSPSGAEIRMYCEEGMTRIRLESLELHAVIVLNG